MARRLFARLNQDASQVSWQFADAGQLEGAMQHGDLDSFAAAAAMASVIVLVPSEEVFVAQVPLPGKNRQRLLHAVPYAVEDQLVDDIEDLHFALSEQGEQGQYWVAAVDKTQMQRWFEALQASGVKVEAMVPEVLAFHGDRDEAVVVLEEDKASVRMPDTAFSCEPHNLPLLLSNALGRQPAENRLRISIYDCSHSGFTQVLGEALDTLEYEARACEHGLLAIVAHSFDIRDSVNLLHGPYSRREKIGQHLRPWLAPAALLAAWVLLVFGLNLYRYITLSQQSERLHTQMVQIYKRAFPDAQKVPAPGYVREQMGQRLEQLRRASGESETSFQAMFASSAPVFAKMNGVTVTAVRYYDGRMDVELDLKQADQLQSLTDELSRKTGWQVKVQSAATRDQTTQVRLQIEGVGG